MGANGFSSAGCARCAALAALVLLAMLAGTVPSGDAIPGDLYAPVYSDGDWWNYTCEGPMYLPARASPYDIDFQEAEGWLRYTVQGSTTYKGRLAWEMSVTGSVHMTGGWSGTSESGMTSMDAAVTGSEWWASKDLAVLGSELRFKGEVEISKMAGPVYRNVTAWENRTLQSPLRTMLFPVPVAQHPTEELSVNVVLEYASGTRRVTVQEAWEYKASYEGLGDVQGDHLYYPNQHVFALVGNVTRDGVKDPVSARVYYDSLTRKVPTVDQVRGSELFDYDIDTTQGNPDLVVGDEGLIPDVVDPTEGTNVTLTAVVYNLGDRELYDVDIELWIAHEMDSPSRANNTTVEVFSARSDVNLAFIWQASEVGNFTLVLRVDPLNTVSEEREDNNEAYLTLTVKHFKPRPNLYMLTDDLIVGTPSPIDRGTAVELRANVRNEGPGDALNITVDFFQGRPGYGGVPIDHRLTIERIAPGESYDVWVTWLADTIGQHSIWVYLDINNTINETKEADNSADTTVVVVDTPVGGVDLQVVRIRLLGENGEEASQLPRDEKATVRVVVDNLGPENASTVHMSVYVDEQMPVGLITSYTGRIDANEPVTWDVPWVINKAEGEHLIIANVIALGSIEKEYVDNTQTLTFSVGPVEQPEPRVLQVTVYPDANILDPGKVIVVSGKVTELLTGFEVVGATVSVGFKGMPVLATATTNERGRYNATITVPTSPGDYRLDVTVSRGRDQGSGHTQLTIKEPGDGAGGSGGDDEGGLNWLLFVVILVVVLGVGVPLTYYALLSKEAVRRRVRHVHEEVVEIVDDEK